MYPIIESIKKDHELADIRAAVAEIMATDSPGPNFETTNPDKEFRMTVIDGGVERMIDVNLVTFCALTGKLRHFQAFPEDCIIDNCGPIMTFAATNGHLAIIKHLESHLDDYMKNPVVRTLDFYGFRNAAEGGHLETILHLESHLSKDEKKEAVKCWNYYAIRWAAANGHNSTVQHFMSHLTEAEKKEAVTACEFEAIRLAAANGHTATIVLLESYLSVKEKKAAVKVNNFVALESAVVNEQKSTIEHLASHLNDEEKLEAAKVLARFFANSSVRDVGFFARSAVTQKPLVLAFENEPSTPVNFDPNFEVGIT
ncbi:MAG: hypothetical protein EPN84_04115 [Legionella sp.]|nr:MAG: hypothetical protein EPN84_04115 [Legionella sp.]